MSAAVGSLRQARSQLARGASLPQALLAATTAGDGAASIVRMSTELRAGVEGAGPVLQPLLEAPGVSDVLVGGGHTWIDRGQGLEEVPSADMTEPQVRSLAVRMAASAGRRLDEASPVVDATMPDGTRLNAVLPPLSGDGTLICLRTSRRRAFTLAELRDAGTVPAGLDWVLTALVEQHASCLVTGATGTGKTTLLAALLGLVSPTERIVCIEEASELRPNHPHVIHLQERGENVEGVGAVPMSALVRTAMRMRPDRIVLGECRGPEVREVLSALNTGHEGGWATLHANSPADVPARLTALGALAGMSEHMVSAQAASALDAVLHLRRLTGGRRVVESVGVLWRRDGELVCEEALARGRAGYVAGPAVKALAARIGEEAVRAALTQQPVPPPPPPPGSQGNQPGRRSCLT
ncbi:TadA family conjugal transfer-associated ATPase [Actinomyces trachealis]|uniref:TadA family conjugal transfer-associated ATPase n=1 Tax=Actinomyces trachealis TaxID=2763540 RepID=UPI0018929FE3|nr:TadA family conjugal transfer-associated ATPase [Actinomyces trachealis]